MRSGSKPGPQTGPAERYLAALLEYEAAASTPSVELGGDEPISHTFSAADALFLGYFLERFPQGVSVLEVGSSPGVPTLWFAGHPGVSRVVNVSPDAARASTVSGVEFSHERQKIRLYKGSPESLQEALKEVDLPDTEEVVAFVGARAREDVARSLAAVFECYPGATVVLRDLRSDGIPVVHAGIADFVGESGGRYVLRRAGDLGPALAGSGVEVLCSEAGADGVGRVLDEVGKAFSRKLDPLRLLGREEELMNTVSKLNRQLTRAGERDARLQKRVARLAGRVPELEQQLGKQRKRNAALVAHYSGRRYRLADALFDALRRLRGKNG